MRTQRVLVQRRGCANTDASTGTNVCSTNTNALPLYKHVPQYKRVLQDKLTYHSITSRSTTTPHCLTPLPSLCSPTPLPPYLPPSDPLTLILTHSSLHPPLSSQGPPAQSWKCVVATHPLPLASQSSASASGEPPGRQRKLKPPLLVVMRGMFFPLLRGTPHHPLSS